MSETRVPSIDGLRAVAVLSVLAGHAFLGSFDDGCRGVDLFFVLSGYCLAAPYLGGRTLDVAGFYARRFARIAPPFYVALALFTLLGFTAFGYPSYVAAAWHRAPGELLRDATFFTMPLAPIHNLAFWTLGVEARWYVVAPFLILLFRRSRLAFALVGLLSYAAAALTGVLDFGTLPAFMLGIVAADVRRHRFAAVGAFVFLLLAILVPHLSTPLSHGNPLWHLAAFCLVLAATDVALLTWPPLVAIGVASYSIYLVHLPFVAYLQKYDVGSLLELAIGLIVGLGFWWLVERRLASRGVLRRIEAALRGRRSQPRERNVVAERELASVPRHDVQSDPVPAGG